MEAHGGSGGIDPLIINSDNRCTLMGMLMHWPLYCQGKSTFELEAGWVLEPVWMLGEGTSLAGADI
jgi:hypothetical protein